MDGYGNLSSASRAMLAESTSVLADMVLDVEKKRKRSLSVSPVSDGVDVETQKDIMASDPVCNELDVHGVRDQGPISSSGAFPPAVMGASQRLSLRKNRPQLLVVPGTSSQMSAGSIDDEPFWSNKMIPKHLSVVNADKLVEVRKIGAGSFSSVYLAEWQGTQVAVKVYHASNLEQLAEDPQDVFREAVLSAGLNHPAIVKTYAIVKYPNTFGLLQERMHGTLRELLQQATQVTGQQIVPHVKTRIALQAAAALREVHSQGLIHFDFKCDNLLVDGSPLESVNIKLCDFGLTREEPKESFAGFSWLGTGPWMAPELRKPPGYSNSPPICKKVDVFSFGVVMWEIWNNGLSPKYSSMPTNPWDYDELRPIPLVDAPVQYTSLMERCWDQAAHARPDMAAVVRELTMLHAQLTGLPAPIV